MINNKISALGEFFRQPYLSQNFLDEKLPYNQAIQFKITLISLFYVEKRGNSPSRCLPPSISVSSKEPAGTHASMQQ